MDENEDIYTDEGFMKLKGQQGWSENVGMFYINLLYEVRPDVLRQFSDPIKHLAPLYPDDHVERLASLLSLIETAGELEQEVAAQMVALDALALKPDDKMDVETDGALLLGAAECLSKLGFRLSKNTEMPASWSTITAKFMAVGIIQQLNRLRLYEEDETNEVSKMALNGLISLNDPSLYRLVFELSNSFEHGQYLNIPNNDAYIIFVKNLLQEVNNYHGTGDLDDYETKVTFAIAGLGQTENARFSFSRRWSAADLYRPTF